MKAMADATKEAEDPKSLTGGVGGDSGEAPQSSRRRRSTLKEQSVMGRFKDQLGHLVALLNQTKPWFVRCVKTNNKQAADTMDATLCIRQLEYAGMMETIRIRQQGFALREEHDIFYKRYRVLSPGSADAKELVEAVSLMFGFDEAQWQLGQKKVFLRKDLLRDLNRLARIRVRASGSKLMRWWTATRRRRASVRMQSWWRRCAAVMLKVKGIAAAVSIEVRD